MKANNGLTRRRKWCLRLGLLAWFALPGCVADKCNTCNDCAGGIGRGGVGRTHRVKDCKDIPAGAIPVCTGTHTTNLLRTQANLAEADDFVIYEHEWLYDPLTQSASTRTGPYGTYHLNLIVKRLPDVPFPVVIQAHLDEKLNEERRVAVVQFLLANGIPDAESRVIIGFPQAEGLYGEEAAGIFRQTYVAPWVLGTNAYGGTRGGIGGIGFGGARGALGSAGVSGLLGGYGGVGGLRR